MKRMLFNATYQEELRVATVEGQKLIDFDIETTSKTQRRGNIYKSVITRVEPSLEACFVDYGTEKQGFLPFKEIDLSYLPEGSTHRDFSKLNEGLELIVQVEKDERGNKGAALTTFVSLPGRYLVLMPNNSRSGGISRRIDGDERDELKTVLSALEVPQNMSIIARTAALGRFPEELQWDLNYLVKLWDAIKTAALNQKGSFLIYQESNLVVRSIRDHFSPDITEILIDTDGIYEQAKQFMSHVMPNFVDRVKLYNDDVPLFSRFQIEHQIETAYGRMVHLPSGGSIAIDHTEALTAIDVNSAKANKGSDIEATALAANLEAADEIARQLRLRDLGGLVVVDFIDMENQKNQREVENFFKQRLGLDRARIQMGKLSKFGLLELSRQRLQASLGESTSIPCPRCSGIGSIRGTESTAVHILRIIEEEAVKNSNYISALHIQLPVEVATYLLNEKRDDVAKIESRMKVRIVLIPNIHLDSPHYKIRKINNDSADTMANKLSYTLVENPDENAIYRTNEKKSDTSLQNNAVVKNITPSHPAPIRGKTHSLSKYIRKFVDLFKNSTTTTEVKSSTKSDTVTPTNRSTTNKTNTNKTRPVGVNRSSNKVQTVRPNKPTSTRSSPNDNNEKSYHSSNNQRSTNKVNVSEKSRPVGQHDNIVENNKARALIRAQENSSQNKNATTPKTSNTVDKVVNQAWKPMNTTPELTSSGTNVAAPTITKPRVEQASASTLPEAKSIVVAPLVAAPIVVTPVIERENTITQKIDLGTLEMIATNKSIVIPEIKVDQAPVKRYNDIEIKPTAVKTEISYELVETKSS